MNEQSTNSALLNSFKSKGETIPGLDIDSLFEKFILPELKKSNKQLNDYINSIPTEEERNKFIEKKKDEFKIFIKEQIDIIKNEFSFIIKNTPKLIELIQNTTITSTAALTTISTTAALVPTGPAAAAALLAQFIPEFKSKKSSLELLLDNLNQSAIKLIVAADKIYFPLPSIVTGYLNTLNTLGGMIEKIPIPE